MQIFLMIRITESQVVFENENQLLILIVQLSRCHWYMYIDSI